MRWNKTERDFAGAARVARLATVDAGGIPHNVPICPLLINGKIYLGTETGAKKVRNVKANPNVSLVFDDYTESWAHLRGLMIQGRARVVSRQDFRKLRTKMYAKYFQYASAAPLGEKDSAIIEVTPRKKFSWGF